MLRSFLGVAAAALLSATPVLAHHAFSADFNSNKPITLDGTVTKVEWTNPHSYLYLDTKDANGKTANWKVELGSRDDLTKDGWTSASMKVGSMVSIRGWQAKNGSKFANADSITMATGNKLTAASSYYSNPGAIALADSSGRSDAVGTAGRDLPGTAGPLPLIGLLGALSSFSAFALHRARR
jgi:hypothetical protein